VTQAFNRETLILKAEENQPMLFMAEQFHPIVLYR